MLLSRLEALLFGILEKEERTDRVRWGLGERVISKLALKVLSPGIPDHLTCLLRNLYAGQEATFRIRHGTMDWFKIGEGEQHGCIFNSAYLTYMPSTSCEMLGWMNHKLESRLLGEISITSDMQMTPPLCQKPKRN